jgi:DNA-binding MarR family transcriptional regulator
VSAHKPSQLPSEPPPTVMAAIRKRFSGREQQAFGATFVVRATAQQIDNAVTEWMAESAATPARFQILMLLGAQEGHGVPHKEIVAALGVTRATVSGLMAALERDGLVTSAVASDDRRNLLASLIERAVETNRARLRTAFTGLSSDELTTLTTLLERVRQGFSVSADGTGRRNRSRDRKSRQAVQMKATRPPV